MLFPLLPLLCENRNREIQNGLRAKSNKDTEAEVSDPRLHLRTTAGSA